uniref:Gypsy retrotransposon integrase-like protein 1 n=1 Tax=Nothobranchius furzeri TaxID=105023 RepID=A0A8C6M7M4_NOTFU
MDLILADLQWTVCLVYLDDIIVFGRDFQEHLARLGTVLEKLRQSNLKVKPSKCDLFSTQVHYLGHVISAEGVKPDPAKIEAVREWPIPANQTEVQSFLGLASYYRRFVKGFADIARPLHRLQERGKRFQWSEECQEVFEKLKTCLITAPVLTYPDPKKSFILDTDASEVGIGAVLSQVEGETEQVIAYASRALTRQERKYATTKKELLSLVTFTKHFKHYLLGKEFVLRTDHNSLRWLHNFQGLEGQLARWVEQLANFQYKIIHRPGRLHSNADALSRLPNWKPENLSADQGAQPLGAELRVCSLQEGGSGASRTSEMDELSQAQLDDPVLKRIRDAKQGVDRIGPDDPELKPFAPVWDQLEIRGSQLVRVAPANSDAAQVIQVVLPRALVPGVLKQLHNAPTGGHLGVQKLQGKIKDRFY